MLSSKKESACCVTRIVTRIEFRVRVSVGPRVSTCQNVIALLCGKLTAQIFVRPVKTKMKNKEAGDGWTVVSNETETREGTKEGRSHRTRRKESP